MKKIAIKELAYFICQSGDLSNEFFSNSDLERGEKAHKYWQNKYNQESEAEIYIKQELSYLDDTYLLHGFIDGVLNEDQEIVIEEIKSTTKDLDEITTEYHAEHLAQLKIYAYLYSLQNNLETVHVRLTYISVIDYETKSFDSLLKQSELEEFTFNILEEYIKWLKLLDQSEQNKNKTIKEIEFPFEEMRQGQRFLMKAVYQALSQNEILYAIAPTGIGKTMATLFAALKTLNPQDKLFYLTAKGSGKSAPIEAIKLLAKNGLKIKTIDITAKSKTCNQGLKNCNPKDCPFAIGYFDRLKAATFEIFENNDIYDHEIILEVANKFKICSFEFSLYLSYFCDIVIADYNYVFDPHAHLIRYFEDDTYKPKVLVDEAHNLISRSKDMYSASISEGNIKTLRAKLNGVKPSVRNDCNKILEQFNSYRELLAEKALFCDSLPDTNVTALLRNLSNKVEQILEENNHIKHKDEIIDNYFTILDFLNTAEVFSSTHRRLVKLINDEISINYFCLDASSFLLETIRSAIHGIVFFSATLYPIEYHMNLLTGGEGKYIELESPFPHENLDLLINNSVSTKYKDREGSIDAILETIETVISVKAGNYIVFFPSYQYLDMINNAIEAPNYELIVQKNNLTDAERQEIVDKFKMTNNSKLGLFVLGGAFAEGIDFIGDALTGVIIVGVGLPMICDENNILKDYFEEEYQKGFDYAYVYPGFTKVIQAVGRVIRSDTDRGIAILIDNRFLFNNYLQLMPPHWTNKKVFSNSYYLKRELILFFNQKK